jgi:tight adherence protein B
MAAGGAAVVILLPHGHVTIWLVEGGLGALAARWFIRRGRKRALAEATRRRVVESCEAVVSELRSGQPPLAALEQACSGWHDFAPVVAACRLDADVPAALRRLAQTPGAGALHEIAAAWQLAHRVGAGLASALERVVEHARSELATHRVVASELASAHATARMMALLPVVTLVLSGGSGADPWDFLLTTTPGLLCLGAGGALAFFGMWWIDRIAAGIDAEDVR